MKRATVTVVAAVLVVTAACSASPVDTTPSVPLQRIGSEPSTEPGAAVAATDGGTEQSATEQPEPTTAESPTPAPVTGTAEDTPTPDQGADEDVIAEIENLLESLDDLDDLLGGLDDDLGDLEDSLDEDEGDIEG